MPTSKYSTVLYSLCVYVRVWERARLFTLIKIPVNNNIYYMLNVLLWSNYFNVILYLLYFIIYFVCNILLYILFLIDFVCRILSNSVLSIFLGEEESSPVLVDQCRLVRHSKDCGALTNEIKTGHNIVAPAPLLPVSYWDSPGSSQGEGCHQKRKD